MVNIFLNSFSLRERVRVLLHPLSLRERARVRGVGVLFNLRPQLPKIIDLSIERNHIASRRRHHGLMAFRR